MRSIYFQNVPSGAAADDDSDDDEGAPRPSGAGDGRYGGGGGRGGVGRGGGSMGDEERVAAEQRERLRAERKKDRERDLRIDVSWRSRLQGGGQEEIILGTSILVLFLRGTSFCLKGELLLGKSIVMLM